MSVLKGNFKTKSSVTEGASSSDPDDLEARFEKEALKRLGGSISFVSKKKVAWDLNDKKDK